MIRVMSSVALLAWVGACAPAQEAADTASAAAADTAAMAGHVHADTVQPDTMVRSDVDKTAAAPTVPAASGAPKAAPAPATRPAVRSKTPAQGSRKADTAKTEIIGYDSVIRNPRRIPATDTPARRP